MKTHIAATRIFLGIAFGIVTVALWAGCDGPTGAPQEGFKVDATSGIKGAITLGPICPVQRWPSDCPDQPLQARLSIQDADGNELARVEAGLDGLYAIELDPGSFVLVAQPLTNEATPALPEQLHWPMPPPAVAVTVKPDVWTTVDLSYDTGIR